ncbi:MAG: HEAT repeat domain-containing protein, partial [bacterium]|nr:HEAT repeat domain-containing protein [bacterium]
MPVPKSDNDVSARGKLLERLTSPSEAARLRAVEALGEDASEAAMQALLGALGDESWRVRQAVVKGLAQRGGDKTSAALLRAIRHEHHSLNVLNSAIQALAASELDVLEPLMELLNAAEADLRTYAALTLGECGDPRAIPALLAALDDDDANARYHAIEALGKLRAHQAVDALLALAQERDFALSFPALDALAAIGDALVAPQIVPLLEDELLRTAAADALGKLGDELAVAPLAALLNKPGA